MITNQAHLFLIFVVNGLLIGLFFDFFRILRKSFKTKDWVTYIQDTLFWVLTGILILYSIFIFNNGQIRLFMFAAIGIGIILYMIIFSTYIIKINVAIITAIKKVIYKILKILSTPFKFIYKLIRKLFLKPVSFIFINIRNLQIFSKKTKKI